jgi:hypothetical protein
MPLRAKSFPSVEHALAQCHGVQKDRRNVCGDDADQAVGQDDMGLAQHSVQIRVERRKALNRKRLQHIRESASAGVPVAEIAMCSSSGDRPLRSAAGPATSRSPTICTAAWASD